MINRKARTKDASFSIFVRLYDKCMTKQNENRVADVCNAVSVRSEADSNRCTRFCRPLPSHSAIRPYIPFGCANIRSFLFPAKLHRQLCIFYTEYLPLLPINPFPTRWPQSKILPSLLSPGWGRKE